LGYSALQITLAAKAQYFAAPAKAEVPSMIGLVRRVWQCEGAAARFHTHGCGRGNLLLGDAIDQSDFSNSVVALLRERGVPTIWVTTKRAFTAPRAVDPEVGTMPIPL
jgi:hypothetical protein